MKILNISPNAPYNDYWGYQDNLLPKYQSKLGHNVTLIVTTFENSENNEIKEVDKASYILNDGVKIIRLPRKNYLLPGLTNLFGNLEGLYEDIIKVHPDLIFFHGLVSVGIFEAIKYKKKINKSCIIVQDNHLDYNIGMTRNGLKNMIRHTWLWIMNRIANKEVAKVYGVTPWRKEYAEDYFGIPRNKTDVLMMGADDDNIDFLQKDSIRSEIRENLGFSDDDFVVISGGKIDKKKNMIELMEACSELKKVKLVIFGGVAEDTRELFDDLLVQSPNITYIGWLDNKMIYNYFLSCELAVFPGQHSVLWEQACASKIPAVFKRWPGMEHVNNGGNAIFLDDLSVDNLKNTVDSLIYTEQYFQMKKISESDNTDVFLYSNIAKKSIEAYNKE